MKKRHHHSMDGDHMLNREMKSKEYYAGVDSRRRMEHEDGGMINEDHNAIANLPQGVVMRPYPPTGPMLPEHLDDSIRSVDYQMDEDDRQRARHNMPRKA